MNALAQITGTASISLYRCPVTAFFSNPTIMRRKIHIIINSNRQFLFFLKAFCILFILGCKATKSRERERDEGDWCIWKGYRQTAYKSILNTSRAAGSGEWRNRKVPVTGTQNTGYCNGDTKVACRLLLKRKEKLIILARLITQIEEIATSSKKLYFAELMYRGLYRGSKFDFSASSAIRLEQIMNIQKMWRRAAPVSFVLFSFFFWIHRHTAKERKFTLPHCVPLATSSCLRHPRRERLLSRALEVCDNLR